MNSFTIGKPAPLKKKGFWGADLDLDEGVFQHAAKDGKSVSMFLQEHRDQKDGGSPYLGLTKHEVMKKQTELRACLQPVPLTALQECYKQLGIQVEGAYSDCVSKFYDYANADIIFGEYWSDMVHAGLLKTTYVNEFSMGEVVINADNYLKVYLETLEQNRQLKQVGEYAEFPEISIKVAKQSVKIQTFGVWVTLSYKAQAQQRLNIFGAALRRIGLQIDIDRMDDLVRTLRLGDGNSNTPGTTVSAVASGTIGTEDVIAWATALPTPYTMDKHIGRKALHQEYLVTLSDFDNPIATWGFMGVDIPRFFEWDRSSIPTDNFIGVDSRYAIQHITNGAVLVETDKVIRQQFNGTAISHGDCFSVFDNDAVALFDETTS